MDAFSRGVNGARWIPAGVAIGILLMPNSPLSMLDAFLIWLGVSILIVALSGWVAVLVFRSRLRDDFGNLVIPDRGDPPAIKGYVILGKEPTDNAYQGVIDSDITMGLSYSHACFFWAHTRAKAGFLRKAHDVDGLAAAERYRHYFAQRYPHMEFTVFDVHKDDLPVTIDWDDWREANEAPTTASGVSTKFRACNPRFFPR